MKKKNIVSIESYIIKVLTNKLESLRDWSEHEHRSKDGRLASREGYSNSLNKFVKRPYSH